MVVIEEETQELQQNNFLQEKTLKDGENISEDILKDMLLNIIKKNVFFPFHFLHS